MALQDNISLLSSIPLFAGLTQDQLRLIAFGAENRSLPAGSMLFREKSPAECAYVVASGSIRLTSTGRQGQSVDEGNAGPGSLLSELALVTLVERKFTAIAEEDSEVMRITRPLFHRLMEEYPQVAGAIENRIRDNIAALAAGLSSMQPYFDRE